MIDSRKQSGYAYEYIPRRDAAERFNRLMKLQKLGTGSVQYVYADGGVGKTKLLWEYIREYKKLASYDDAQREVIDFYDIENHSMVGLRRNIVSRIGLDFFSGFLGLDKQYQDYDLAEKDHKTTGRMTALQYEAEPAFFDELRKVPAEVISNTLLIFDTFEVAFNRPVGRWFLSQFLPEVANAGYLIVFAGRPNDLDLGIDVDELQLTPYTQDEALDYFKRKFPDLELGNQELLAIEAAEGMPLLLDLIAFYLDQELVPSEGAKNFTRVDLEHRIIQLFSREEDPYNKVLREIAYLKYRYDKDVFDYRKSNYPGISDYSTLKAAIKNHPFVKYRVSDDSLALHDAFRDMVENNFSRWHGVAIELNSDILKWYEGAIISNKKLKDQLQAEKLAYVLNLGSLYKNTLQGEKDYQLAKSLLTDFANQKSDALNRLVINEVLPEVVCRFPRLEDQSEIFSILGRMSQQVHRLIEAQQYWANAAEVAQKLNNPKLQIDALIEQHNSTWQTEPEKSFELLKEAAALCKDDKVLLARIQYEIGFTYTKVHNLPIAISHYHEALKTARSAEMGIDIRTRIGTIYNDLGYTYLLMGDYDNADVYISKARAERSSLLDSLLKEQEDLQKTHSRNQNVKAIEEKINDARWRLGLTFNSSGDLARYLESFDAASIDYSEAVEIFKETNPNHWLAIALHQRGDAYRQIAVLASRSNRVVATQEYDGRAYQDIVHSIRLVDENGLSEVRATATRRLARLLHDRVWRLADSAAQLHLLDEVYNTLRRALGYARNNSDPAEELECLREIAFLADDRTSVLMKEFGKIEPEERARVEGYIRQYRDGLALQEQKEFKIYTFSVFKTLYTLVEAAYTYSLGEDYSLALDKYIEAFVALAGSPGYGVGCYRKHRPHLWERIRLLDPERRREWCERFRDAWAQSSVSFKDGNQLVTKSLADLHPKMSAWFNVELDSLGVQ